MKTLIKFIASTTLAIALLSSCSSTPFVANTSNDTLVGQWKVSEVTSEEALGTGVGEVAAMVAQKYAVGETMSFEKGSGYSIVKADGSSEEGLYGFAADNKGLHLQEKGETDYLVYGISLSGNTLVLSSKTAGESEVITLTKQ